MLTHLKLENFKIWRSTGPMRLAPISLFLGANSSGKSSLIQSLLLIRQTVKGADPNLDLNFGSPDAGDTVTLGQFKDVLCRHGAGTETLRASQIGIEFGWRPDAEQDWMFTARYQKGFGGSAELSYLRLGREQEGFIAQRRRPGEYRLWIGTQKKAIGQSREYRPQRSFAFPSAVVNKLGAAGEQIAAVGPTLLAELGRIVYLGPVRRLAQRDYVWAGRMPATIGDDGSKAVDALIASGVIYQSAVKRKQPSPDGAHLFERTIHWLHRMGLADGLRVRPLGNSARYELLVENYGEASNLMDVGVGVSQVIPVVVAALFAPRGHTVIVEEPETHLHPLAQRILAELFIDVHKERNVQFIVETHSEHLFRRMQTLIAEQRATTGDVASYFVEREGKDAQLQRLEVDEFGRVANWPNGFFGDALGETREQARLMFERMSERK